MLDKNKGRFSVTYDFYGLIFLMRICELPAYRHYDDLIRLSQYGLIVHYEDLM